MWNLLFYQPGWFGTCFMTFHIFGMSSSQLTNSIIFQRDSTHQPGKRGWSFWRSCLTDVFESTGVDPKATNEGNLNKYQSQASKTGRNIYIYSDPPTSDIEQPNLDIFLDMGWFSQKRLRTYCIFPTRVAYQIQPGALSQQKTHVCSGPNLGKYFHIGDSGFGFRIWHRFCFPYIYIPHTTHAAWPWHTCLPTTTATPPKKRKEQTSKIPLK